MEGHEGTPPVEPEIVEADGSLPPEHLAIIAQQAAALAVEALEPVILTLGENMRSLAGQLEAVRSRADEAAPESRLDSIEARLNAFGNGGETVGDALALGAFALATARAIAAAVERSQGVSIPLPPAPEQLAPAGTASVIGAELADAVAL